MLKLLENCKNAKWTVGRSINVAACRSWTKRFDWSNKGEPNNKCFQKHGTKETRALSLIGCCWGLHFSRANDNQSEDTTRISVRLRHQCGSRKFPITLYWSQKRSEVEVEEMKQNLDLINSFVCEQWSVIRN